MSDKVIITREQYDELLLFRNNHERELLKLNTELKKLKADKTIFISSHNEFMNEIEINVDWSQEEIIKKIEDGLLHISGKLKDAVRARKSAEEKLNKYQNLERMMTYIKEKM